MRKINSLIILLLLIFSVTFVYAQNSKSKKKEKIAGTIIAHYSLSSLLCVYHPCTTWLIVRLDKNKGKEPVFARIAVEYFPDHRLSNKGFPVRLIDKARKWKFSAVRNSSGDTPIEKYVKTILVENEKDVTEEAKITAWELLPGAENEKIPVGKILPFYSVKSRDYKEISK